MSYKRQELFTLREYLGSPPILVGSVLLIFLVFCVVVFGGFRVADLLSFLCCVFVVGLRHVSCLPNVASFSVLSILDWPFGFL